jgi:hypothetical protein
LKFLRSHNDLSDIQTHFGISQSTACREVWFSIDILLSLLKFDPYCVVEWPSSAQMVEYSRTYARIPRAVSYFQHLHSQNIGVFGVVDGSRLAINDPGCPYKQNAYYNGSVSGCNINNVFVTAPTGRIIWYKVNSPGSWHDIKVATELTESLQDRTRTPSNMRLFADSGFTSPQKKYIISGNESNSRFNDVITALRQSAEWSNRSLFFWSRVKSHMHMNSDDDIGRSMIMKLAIYLTNFRTSFMGVNQTRTYFENNCMSDEEIATMTR